MKCKNSLMHLQSLGRMFGIKNPRMFTTLEKGFSDTTTAKLIRCSSTVTMVLWKTGILYVSKCFTAVMLVSTLCSRYMVPYILNLIGITFKKEKCCPRRSVQWLWVVSFGALSIVIQFIIHLNFIKTQTSLQGLLKVKLPIPRTSSLAMDISYQMLATIVISIKCFIGKSLINSTRLGRQGTQSMHQMNSLSGTFMVDLIDQCSIKTKEERKP